MIKEITGDPIKVAVYKASLRMESSVRQTLIEKYVPNPTTWRRTGLLANSIKAKRPVRILGSVFGGVEVAGAWDYALVQEEGTSRAGKRRQTTIPAKHYMEDGSRRAVPLVEKTLQSAVDKIVADRGG